MGMVLVQVGGNLSLGYARLDNHVPARLVDLDDRIGTVRVDTIDDIHIRQVYADIIDAYADKADTLPHNTKVFNLCLINKMGLEKWAQAKAQDVRSTYFTKPWTLA